MALSVGLVGGREYTSKDKGEGEEAPIAWVHPEGQLAVISS